MSISKCLICCGNVGADNGQGLVDEPGSFSGTIGKQLRVIFILKNILEVSNVQLEKFLEVKGNPDGWIQLCNLCHGDIGNITGTFFELQRTLRKFQRQKLIIHEKIKAVSTTSRNIATRTRAKDEDDVGSVCRQLVLKCNYQPSFVSPPETTFEQDDLVAEQHLQSWITGALRASMKQEVIQEPEEEVRMDTDFDSWDPPMEYDDEPACSPSPVNVNEVKLAVAAPSSFEEDRNKSVSARGRSLRSKIWTPPKKLTKPRRPATYHCDFCDCDMAFSNPAVLIKHKKEEHNNSVTSAHVCSICGKIFKKRNSWEMHLRIMHGVQKRLANQKVYCCPVDQCLRTYVVFENLGDHMRKMHGKQAPRIEQCKIRTASQMETTLGQRRRPSLYCPPPSPPPAPAADNEPETNEEEEESLEDSESEFEIDEARGDSDFVLSDAEEMFSVVDPSATLSREPRRSRTRRDGGDEIPTAPEEGDKGPKFTCSLCADARPSYFPNFLDHIYHFHQIPYKCKLCPMMFRMVDDKAILRHWKKDHDDVLEQYRRVQEKLERVVLELPTVTWSCLGCSEQFQDENLRTSHLEGCSGVTEDVMQQRTHSCEACGEGRLFFTDEELQLHVVMEHPGLYKVTPYKCDDCLQYFRLESSLLFHRANYHQERVYKCYQCESSFFNENSLTMHLALKHGISKTGKEREKIPCEYCGKAVHDLERHIERLHTSRLSLTCEHCGKVLSSKGSLRHHLAAHHGINEGNALPTLPCPEPGCSKVYYSKTSLQKHMKSHEGRHLCSVCGRSYSTQTGLDEHELLIHKITKPSTESIVFFECSICSIRYRRKNQLMAHQATCGVVPDPVECDLCKLPFNTKADLRTHKIFKHALPPGDQGDDDDENEEENKIQNPKPDDGYTCSQCGILLSSEPLLRRHERREHELGGTGTGKANCEICGKIMTKHALKRHMAKFHGVGLEEFQCADCGAFLDNLAVRRRHVCGAKDARPIKRMYCCQYCGKEWPIKSVWRKHVAHVHQKKFAFNCDLCSFGSSLERRLAHHKAVRHNVGLHCATEGCTKVFESEKFMQEHVRYDHLGEERPKDHVCKQCHRRFDKKRNLANHIARNHKKKPEQNLEKVEVSTIGF